MLNGLFRLGKNRSVVPLLGLFCLAFVMVALFVPVAHAQPGLPEVLPLSNVYSDGPPTIADLNATNATVTFVSSVPLVCSVVYGTDSNYGQIATDLDMAGGAHTTHQPLLGGLMPDTEYVYRVQGTAADGTLYASDQMSFRTPSESTVDPSTEVNVAALAAGAAVSGVSSNYRNGPDHGIWGANYALDGNAATAWSSDGDGNDAFIDVQLSQAAIPHAVEVWTRTMANGTAQISEFTLTANAGTTTSETFGPFTLPDQFRAYRFEIAPAQVVSTMRLDVVESSGGNTGLLEFGVFADITVVATKTNSVNLYLPVTIR